MIANELVRGKRWLEGEVTPSLRYCYERVVRLTDLTVQTQPARHFRRELLRWRDLIGALYIAPTVDAEGHRAALRCLLLLTPVAARQIPYVLP